MDRHYPPITVDSTPDDVLAVVRDMHRQQCAYDPEANPCVSLSHDSTIAEWRDACDLLPWAQVAEAMNSFWSVAIPMAEWWEALEPPKTRPLRGVCELLAGRSKVPRIRPATILGARCVTAGAFLTVRSHLADAGADVSNLAPSTPLGEYTRQYAGVFLGPVSRLAPGALPTVKIRTPVYHTFIYGMLVAWVAGVVGLCAGLHAVALLAGLATAICYGGIWIAARRLLPTSVEFPGLVTFRDLSRMLAAGART